MGLLALLLAGACAAPAPVTPVKAPADDRRGGEIWVDAFAREGGDGTRQLPFHSVPSDLHRGVTVHLATGVYPTPLRLPDGARVEGHGRAVIALEGPGDVVVIHDGALSNLSVQGGTTGVRVTGRAALAGVHFSGHREAAVAVEKGAALSLADAVFENPVAGSNGVNVEGGEARLARVSFMSGWRRAVAAKHARVWLEQVRAEGVTTLLHAVDGESHLTGVRVAAGQGAAVFAAQGTLELTDVEVDGHEYALQAANARVTARRFTSRRAQYAGVALLACTSELDGVTVADAGAHGAVTVLGGTLKAGTVKVVRAAALGVFLRQADADLRAVLAEGVRAEQEANGDSSLGDALHVRGGAVTVGELRTSDTGGSALFATMHAQVRVRAVLAERAAGGALFAERFAEVTVRHLTVHGGGEAAVVVPEQAKVTLERVTSVGPQIPVWAECASGAEVTLGPVEGLVQQPPAPCIRAPSTPPR